MWFKLRLVDMSVSKEVIELQGYEEPAKGFLSYLPSSWVPYAELMRLNKPVGFLNIYFPYLYGSLFAACITQPVMSPKSVILANAKLFPIAFLLRSASCT
jgi:4-hydroxybenzoate polyprenyltransferase